MKEKIYDLRKINDDELIAVYNSLFDNDKIKIGKRQLRKLIANALREKE